MLEVSQQIIFMKNNNFKLWRFSFLFGIVLGCLLSHLQTANSQASYFIEQSLLNPPLEEMILEIFSKSDLR